jgi:hypothetical protein
MNKDTVSVIVRALLQASAGALAARGIAIENSHVEAVIGGILALVTVIWSLKSKKAASTTQS